MTPPEPRRATEPKRWQVAIGIAMTAVAAACLFLAVYPAASPAFAAPLVERLTGANPDPVKLVRPPDRPLSALAKIGE